MTIAVDQPNYIPWKGYFDLIHDVDLFVFYNDVQYTSRDWRNRNKIITHNGIKWLTVPVGHSTHRLIYEVQICDGEWQRKHYDTLRHAYGKAPYFKKYKDFLENVYLERRWTYLHELDQYMTEHIAREFLGIKTKFADSREYKTHGAKHERLLNLILDIGGVEPMSPAPRQKIILSDKIMSETGLSLSGNLMRDILSILNLEMSLRIRFPYWIFYSMLEMRRRTISGDGGKRQGPNPGWRTQKLCCRKIALRNGEVAI